MTEVTSKLGHKYILVLTLISSILMIVDSIIVSIYLSIPRIPSSQTNIMVFLSFVLFFIISNYFFLRYVNSGSLSATHRDIKQVKFITKSIVFIQSAISVVLIYMIAQIVIFGNYNLVSMIIVIFLSHVMAIGFLVLLVYLFINWYLSRRSKLMLAYAFAFMMIVTTLVISLIYLSIELSYYDPFVKLRSIKASIGDYSNYGTRVLILGQSYTYTSIISFISIWIPSVILLRTYFAKIGKLLYWTLVSIPLIFFLFLFISDELGIFDSLFLEYGPNITLLYYIIFSPYKQIGGLLFGIVFWLTAMRIERKNLKVLVNTAGIGMILLFSSTVLHGLTYVVAPPFGLVTVSYLGLAAYMLLIGIFTSAKELSRDNMIRREIYKVAGEQFNLFRNISEADLVRTSEKQVKAIIDKVEIQGNQPQEMADDESDYKKFLQEAVDEIAASKLKKSSTESKDSL